MRTDTSSIDRQRGFQSVVPLPRVAGLVDRRLFLPHIAAGRRVVHLGCVDDRLVESRVGSGSLLHEELARVATSLVGVDISRDGLELMSRLVPGSYVCGDVEELDLLPLPDECDVVIAGEIIEHLGAPDRFLASLCRYLAQTGATGWITTPNAYAWVNTLRFALAREEHTHPDHRHLYSPATLRCALDAAGLELMSIRVHRWRRERRDPWTRVRNAFDSLVLRWNPLLGPGLVVEVRPRVARPDGI